MKVLLCSMPLGALERQALGISILKAAVRERGFHCDLKYLTFPFAELIGDETYRWLSYSLPYTAFAGDWCFTEALYGPDAQRDADYEENILRREWALSDDSVARIWDVRRKVPLFLTHCLSALPWKDYDVVGFTSTFEQNIASLALAQQLKASYPRMRIVFGGANWEAEMGLELHSRFPFVDFVCSGEADYTFPALVAQLAKKTKQSAAESQLPGLIYRSKGKSIYTGPAELVRDLDAVPTPDFDDYFRELAESTVEASVVPSLLFESSRGCWWGAKSHCTFCGLNGGAMSFRHKSAAATLKEVSGQLRKHRTYMLEAVDNILDMQYFREFLPALENARLGAQVFYEVKANLSRNQLRALRSAGVSRLQPGIESLSDHVLNLMRKGTTGLRNAQFLKWCQEYTIQAEWNILYGFPGETREDYAEMLALLRQLTFLHPPSACGPIRLDRFSPFHNEPARFGMRNVRPMKTFRHLYPFPDESLSRIAYYFEFDYEPGTDPRGYADEVIAFCESWRAQPESGKLWAERQASGTLLLLDGRNNAAYSNISLSGMEQAVYEYCDEYHSAAAVTRRLRALFPGEMIEEQNVSACLESMVANRLMVSDGRNYLSIALAGPTLRKVLEDNAEESHLAPSLPSIRGASTALLNVLNS